MAQGSGVNQGETRLRRCDTIDRAVAKAQSSSIMHGMNGKRIVIGDGNARDRQILSNWLTAADYEVLVAEDGSQVVNTTRGHQPDLVILNTHFPPDVAHGGGAFDDGFHVINWLARLQETEATRFLLITDGDAQKLQDQAKATGAKGLCQKPINPETLVKVVQQILGDAPLPSE
jgi:two-component system chemotaxis response regulator CheY